MSEENQSPEESPVKKPRKAATPRAKKAVKAVKAEKAPAKPARDTSGLPDVPQTPSEESRRAPEPEPQEAPRVEARRESPQAAEDSARSGWPEIETIQGGNQPPTSGKRKRRRKKKGGQGGQAPVGVSLEAAPIPPRPPQSQPRREVREVQDVSEPVEAAPPRQQGPRVQLDLDDLAKKAWKIFQSEVAEEGMALIGDHDARELSRKSFRLAEIFLEEQSRRIR